MFREICNKFIQIGPKLWSQSCVNRQNTPDCVQCYAARQTLDATLNATIERHYCTTHINSISLLILSVRSVNTINNGLTKSLYAGPSEYSDGQLSAVGLLGDKMSTGFWVTIQGPNL